MCGIAGLIGSKADAATVQRVADQQRHRGPDDIGVWCERGSGPGAHAALDPRPVRGRPSTDASRAADDRLQRRDLQLPRTARQVAGPVPVQFRYRGSAAPVPGARRPLHRAPAGHVRVRNLGQRSPPAVRRTRPPGHQAVSLLHERRHARIRLGGRPAEGGLRRGDRSHVHRRLHDLRVHPVAQDDIRRASANCRPRTRWSSKTGNCRCSATGARRSTRRSTT